MGEGQYRVVGTNHGGSATRIRRGNWIANSQTVSGVTDDVIIDMRGGGDRLNFSHTPAYGPYSYIPDDLTVRTGDGLDEVDLSWLQIGDDVFVDLGNQDDILRLYDSTIGRDDGTATHNLEVLGQAGADSIYLTGDSLSPPFTGDGEATLVRGDVLVNAGTSTERDYVMLNDLHILDDVEVRTFGGEDTVSVGSCQIDDDITVESGSGKDRVTISRTDADEIFARLGSGDEDYLGVYYGSRARRATFDGGPGIGDELVQSGNQFMNEASIFGFET